MDVENQGEALFQDTAWLNDEEAKMLQEHAQLAESLEEFGCKPEDMSIQEMRELLAILMESQSQAESGIAVFNQFESAMNRWPEAHQDADKEMSNKLETLKLNDDGGAQSHHQEMAPVNEQISKNNYSQE